MSNFSLFEVKFINHLKVKFVIILPEITIHAVCLCKRNLNEGQLNKRKPQKIEMRLRYGWPQRSKRENLF